MVLSLPSSLVTAVALIWAVGITIWLFILFRSLSRITAGTKKERLDEILEQLLSDFRKEHQSHKVIQDELAEIKNQLPSHLRKIGLVRFNPFVGTGGNQSFSLAILDGQDTGLVITSLHSREGTRLYTKSVKGGKSDGELSNEEQRALKTATTTK